MNVVMTECRRRAYLGAMQVDVWLPRVALPYAAPAPVRALRLPTDDQLQPPLVSVVQRPQVVQTAYELARPISDTAVVAPAAAVAPKGVAFDSVLGNLEPVRSISDPIPQFTVQLFWAGSCLLVVDVPHGAPLRATNPLTGLLLDLLHAAHLPKLQFHEFGEQEARHWIQWPLWSSKALGQDPEAACIYVQAVINATQERTKAANHIWLLGPWAVRFGGGFTDSPVFERQPIPSGSGAYWLMPSLEMLRTDPSLKRKAWKLICQFLDEEIPKP